MLNQSTMVAASFTRCGAPDQVLALQAFPVPEPAPGEVRVRMQAASMHPADRMFMAGTYRQQPVFPQRAGLVGAGVVAQCGAGVEIPVGTPVAFRSPGAWAECCIVAQERLFLVPAGIDMADACQFALNPVTAWALLDVANVQPGEWLALNASHSNVAHMVRSLARRRGVRVVAIPDARTATAGSPDALAQTLRDACSGEAIAAVLDAVGGPQLSQVLPALREGAVLVSYGLLSSLPAPIHNADLIYRNLTWHGFGVDRWLAGNPLKREAMQAELWEMIAAGELPLPVRGRYALGELQQALEADATPGSGKVILTMGEAA